MVKSVKNKGIPSFFCLAMLVMLQSNSCTSCSGIPSDFNKVVLHATSTGPQCRAVLDDHGVRSKGFDE